MKKVYIIIIINKLYQILILTLIGIPKTCPLMGSSLSLSSQTVSVILNKIDLNNRWHHYI